MSKALEEAILQVKTYREHAEAADSKAAGLQIKLNKLDSKFDRLKKEKDGAEFALQQAQYENQRLRDQIKELQAELDPKGEPRDVEVIAFVDDCGHQGIVNVTGAAQKLKIYRQLLTAAHKQDCIYSEHYDVDKLLKEGTVEEIQECLNDADIGLGSSREGLDPVGACNDWPDIDLRP